MSFPDTATPGESNYLPIPNVVINEVLTHSDEPLEDAIEVHNLSAAPVDISGWYLSDSRTFLEKFRIPDGTVLAPNSYRVFYEFRGTNGGFNPRPGEADSFALSSAKGDKVYLSSVMAGELTGYRREVSFGPAENSVSFGRYVTTAVDGNREEFVAMASRTFGVDNPDSLAQFRTGRGLANSGPKLGPVVISEIMYHPPDLPGGVDNVRDEFIELRNVTGLPVQLFDPVTRPTGGGCAMLWIMIFRPIRRLPPGGLLLVVSFDPQTNTAARAAFEAAYGLTSPVPWSALCGQIGQ